MIKFVIFIINKVKIMVQLPFKNSLHLKSSLSMIFCICGFHLLIFSSYLSAYSQSLTVDETINYINNIFRNNPTVRDDYPCKAKYYFNYSISNDGTLSYIRNYYICDCDKNSDSYYSSREKHETKNFICGNLNDFIINTLEKESCQAAGGYYIDEFKIRTKWNKLVALSYNIFQDDYLQQKLLNAFRYLISIVQTSKSYKRQDYDDPFAPHNINKFDVNQINNGQILSTCTIPIKKEGNLSLVTLRIGNLENSFILDSGASDVSISTELEQQLIQSGDLSEKDYLPNGLYKLADGSVKSCKRILLKSIFICNFKVTNTVASITNDDALLLLGKSFLNKFKKWSIDNSKSVLNLEK